MKGSLSVSAIALAIAALMLCGCVPSGRLERAQAPAPAFDPIAFFAGHTQGRGSLKILTKRRIPLSVEGRGVIAKDGSIILDQDVRQGDRPVKHRTWHLRQTAPGRYAGTLTDAVGPVIGEVVGNTLYVSFMLKGGLRAQQWLYLQPGGQVSQNRMVVTMLGVPVASLDESIVRVAP